MNIMKQYKVIDERNRYRNDPDRYEIKRDDDKAFYLVDKGESGEETRIMILNPLKFQEERIVDEKEAAILILKGVKVEEVGK